MKLPPRRLLLLLLLLYLAWPAAASAQEKKSPTNVQIPVSVGPESGADTVSHVAIPSPAQVPDPSGFSLRRKTRSGAFFTREQIESKAFVRLSDILRRVPGISARSDSRRGVRIGRSRDKGLGERAACPWRIYLNGFPTSIDDPDRIPIRDVDGVEVYTGPGTAPPRFDAGSSRCGVILIWTRGSNAP